MSVIEENEWKMKIQEELNQVYKKDTLDLVSDKKGTRDIVTIWMIKIKLNNEEDLITDNIHQVSIIYNL